MPDRHDDVDAWLSERINPLPPPPGTFELIKRRARRRKIRRLAITATSAAVIVAAAVTVPQVVNLPVLSQNPTSAAQAGQSATATPTGGGGRTQSSAAVPLPPPRPTAAPVPADFQPTSVTFVGAGTGWVIGQAGTPGDCASQYCTSVARTNDAGRTWAGVPAPLTGAPDGATGVSQIRFLNLTDGWAFGPELWVTHTGGQTWTQVDTHGLRVTDLETVGSRVFALFASCTGGGQEFAGPVHELHALLLPRRRQHLDAGGRRDDRPHRRRRQRGRLPGAHRPAAATCSRRTARCTPGRSTAARPGGGSVRWSPRAPWGRPSWAASRGRRCSAR